jgi:hypothetical protein
MYQTARNLYQTSTVLSVNVPNVLVKTNFNVFLISFSVLKSVNSCTNILVQFTKNTTYYYSALQLQNASAANRPD